MRKMSGIGVTVAVATLSSLSAVSPSHAASVVHLFNVAGVQQISGAPEAPPFAVTTIDGRRLDSGTLRGKVVLVNFWAPWCGPCKDEMPALQRLRQSLGHRDFELLAVTGDGEQDAIRSFVQALKLGFPILLDETKDMSAAFGVRGLPTTVLIDRNGRWVGRAVGPRIWDSPEMITLFKSLTESR